MQKIQGTIQRIIYQSVDGYHVFTVLTSDNKWLTCTANMHVFKQFQVDDQIEIIGHYEEHVKYGRQFHCDYITEQLPSDLDVMITFLSHRVHGIGPALARRLVDAFGDHLVKIILEQPERLIEVPGISEAKAQSLYEYMVRNTLTLDEQLFFVRLGIGSSCIAQIKKVYGGKAQKLIEKNPYRLIDDITGIGFLKADEIARKLGIAEDSPFRIEHGISFALEQAAALEGHTFLPRTILLQKAADLLKLDHITINPILDHMVKANQLVVEGSLDIYLPSYHAMEQTVAKKIHALNAHVSMETNDAIASNISKFFENTPILLDEKQKEAVLSCIKEPVTVLTGGPGTGKTTTIKTILQYFESLSYDVTLLAPTGRAAQRMSEQTGHHASTIHRMVLPLLQSKEKMQTDVVIVDELSMVDLMLFHMLLSCMDDGTKLICVGDVDQLPSIGPGAVLQDLIDSQKVSVVRLSRIYRQADNSSIITNAHQIIQGHCFSFEQRTEDFAWVTETEDDTTLQDILTLYTKNLVKHFQLNPTDIQILAPMKRGLLGVDNLNKVIQAEINPPNTYKHEVRSYTKLFREGDKVMQTRNNYQLDWIISDHGHEETGHGVFNGDVGYILTIDTDKNSIIVRYEDGRRADYDIQTALDNLMLAYAITIHKSQGSEYPVVIIPLLHGGPPNLFNKQLLYTAITRAKHSVVLLGQAKVIHQMLANSRHANGAKRYTGLEEKIRAG